MENGERMSRGSGVHTRGRSRGPLLRIESLENGVGVKTNAGKARRGVKDAAVTTVTETIAVVDSSMWRFLAMYSSRAAGKQI